MVDAEIIQSNSEILTPYREASDQVMYSAKRHRLFKLAASLLKIGCIGFGGGNALIPVIEREVVTDQKAVSENDFNKTVVIANLTPGAVPISASAGLGKTAYGLKGMILSALAMAFPGALLTVIILSSLSLASPAFLSQIQYLSIGLCAFISCMLTSYAVKTMQTSAKAGGSHLAKSWLVMLGVFLLTCGGNIHKLLGIKASPIFGLSTVQVLGIAFFVIFYTHERLTKVNAAVSAACVLIYILCAGKAHIIANTFVKTGVLSLMIVLAIRGLYLSMTQTPVSELKKNKDAHGISPAHLAGEAAAWFLMVCLASIPAFMITRTTLPYLLKGFLSTLMSFGGGDSYLSVADGMFVGGGMISNTEFYSHLVPIVNVLPGSILAKTLSGIGYYLGYNISHSTIMGVGVALSGFAIAIASTGFLFCVIYYIYTNFENVCVFQQISYWIRPIVSGLLLNVMLSLFTQSLASAKSVGIATPITVTMIAILFVSNLYLLFGKKKSSLTLIGLSAGSCLLVCNLMALL